MAIKSLRGMNDIFSPDIRLWNQIESHARHFFELYGYDEKLLIEKYKSIIY